jgi:hypothetical protein
MDGSRRRQDRVGRWRGKDVAHGNAIDATLADVADEGGLAALTPNDWQ